MSRRSPDHMLAVLFVLLLFVVVFVVGLLELDCEVWLRRGEVSKSCSFVGRSVQ